MKVEFTKNFLKQYRKASVKIRRSFDKRLELFMKDRYNPLLNNHALSGKLLGYRSINVTGDWRALFREFKNGDFFFFEILGTHGQLYR